MTANEKVTWQKVKRVWDRKDQSMYGLDAIELSPLFRIAEMKVVSDDFRAASMYNDFLEWHPDTPQEVVDDIINVIKTHTIIKGTLVYDLENGKRTRRYA